MPLTPCPRLSYLVFPIALCACGSDPAPTGATIGSNGGTVSEGGASVTVPRDALSVDTSIAIADVTGQVAELPRFAQASGPAFAFTPHGTKFKVPVTIQLPHDGLGDSVMKLDDDADTTWELVPDIKLGPASVDLQTDSFSIYMVTSKCAGYCQFADKTCPSAGPGNMRFQSCLTACQNNAGNPSPAKMPSGCQTSLASLFDCYTSPSRTAADFDCSGTLDPTPGVCATELTTAHLCATPACGDLSGAWAGVVYDTNSMATMNEMVTLMSATYPTTNPAAPTLLSSASVLYKFTHTGQEVFVDLDPPTGKVQAAFFLEEKRWVTSEDMQASCSTTPALAQELKWTFVVDAANNENLEVTLTR